MNWKTEWEQIREQAIAEVNGRGNLHNIKSISRIHAFLYNHKFKTTKCGNTLIGWVVEIENKYKAELPKPVTKKRGRSKKKK